MKTRTKVIIAMAALAGVMGLAMNRSPSDAQASGSVQINSREDFEAPLTPCGTWIEVSGYGRCFRPAGVAVEWRPYCYGHWVWTDCGWYWASDEPWAWACYHYGTWVDDPVDGWVWVPGIEWAPAWVEWRFGGGFIGWAPCAPRGVVVAPGLFAFVEVGRFHDPIRPGIFVVNSAAIVNRTTRFADFRTESRNIDGRSQRIAVNDGPGPGAIEKATGRQETVVPLHEAMLATPAPHEVRPAVRQTEPTKVDRTTQPERSLPPAGETGRDGGVVSPERHAPPAIPPPAKSSGEPGREKGGGKDRDGGHGRGGF